MAFKDVLKKAFARDPQFKEMEREIRMQKMIEDRMKNADERELERFYEEERQKSIKKNLEEFRKARREENWHGDKNSILKQKNIFTGHKSILKQDFSILGGKKLFSGKSNSLKGGCMFIK